MRPFKIKLSPTITNEILIEQIMLAQVKWIKEVIL